MKNQLLPQCLPKNDPRYIIWKNSLSKRPLPWNKGITKRLDSRVKKISATMKEKKINNFQRWKEKMIKDGKILVPQVILTKSYNLAVLIGLILGDGHIEVFPRTEILTISLNTKYPDLVTHTTTLVQQIFNKKPNPAKIKNVNCIRISLYEKDISKRLGIISGNRSKDTLGVPLWIFEQKKFIIGCLKGLFEAEGSLSIHLRTSTYNFQFRNNSPVLLKNVKDSLIKLGFHPEIRVNSIRLRKKHKVEHFKKLISFREYPCGVV